MKLSFYTLLILLNLCFLMSSCSSEDKIDGPPPTISDVRFNVDTEIIYLKDETKLIYDTVIINPSIRKDENALDILIFDNPVKIGATLGSDNGLTNMKVKIYGDTANVDNLGDKYTVLNITEVPITSFYGKDTITIKNVSVTSSLASSVLVGEDKKTVREDDDFRYTLYVIDREGKIGSITHPIAIMTMDEVVEMIKENNK